MAKGWALAKYKVADFMKAIPGTGGVISSIADRVGCKWHTAKKYIDKYPKLTEAYEAERSRVTDKAQSNIITAIVKDGDLPMSKWWLAVKDPDFKDKQDINHDGGLNIVINWDDEGND